MQNYSKPTTLPSISIFFLLRASVAVCRAALHFRLAIIALDMRILTKKCENPILT